METKNINRENISLITEAQKGNDAAISEIIKLNTNLVHYIAQRFVIHSERFGYDDLFQEGMLGLLDAIKNFNTASGLKFSTLAYNLIRFKIINFINSNSSQFYVPKGTAQVGVAINKFIEEETSNGNPIPSINKISQHIGVSADIVSFFTDRKCVNLSDSPYEGCKYSEIIPDTSLTPDIACEKQSISEGVVDVMNEKLDSEERYILFNHFGFNGRAKTLVSIAKELGISSHVISTKYRGAIRKLKIALTPHAII